MCDARCWYHATSLSCLILTPQYTLRASPQNIILHWKHTGRLSRREKIKRVNSIELNVCSGSFYLSLLNWTSKSSHSEVSYVPWFQTRSSALWSPFSFKCFFSCSKNFSYCKIYWNSMLDSVHCLRHIWYAIKGIISNGISDVSQTTDSV